MHDDSENVIAIIELELSSECQGEHIVPQPVTGTVMKSGGIFINYRRCDGAGTPNDYALFVEILSHELADHFGAENIFMDTSTNVVNEYAAELRAKLATCDVLLVVIHPEWVDDLKGQLSKLTDNEVDPVYHEIRSTMNRTLHLEHSGGWQAGHPKVIPILLENADPPKSAELPEDIRELALLQAFRLRFGSLAADLFRLRAELEIHTVTCWPPVPPPLSDPDENTQNSLREISRRTAPGPLASRGVVTAAFAVSFSQFAPEEHSQWTSVTFFLIWSTMTILGTLLGVVLVTIFGQSLHRLEHHLHSLPPAWFLIVRLGLFAMAMILLLSVIEKLGNSHFLVLVIAVPGSIILVSYIVIVTIHDFRENNRWPPQFSMRTMALRRTIVRLERQLITLEKQPPLSRIQREQAGIIFRQLDCAIITLRRAAEGTQTRRSWFRFGCPRLTVGYAIWLAGTLGLAAASMRESSVLGDSLGWYLSVPIGVVACGLGISTMELMFRNDRKFRCWFIDEIKNDYENRLLRNTPAYPIGQS